MSLTTQIRQACWTVALGFLATSTSGALATESEGTGTSVESGSTSSDCRVCSSNVGVGCPTTAAAKEICNDKCRKHDGSPQCTASVVPACEGINGKFYHDRISCGEPS